MTMTDPIADLLTRIRNAASLDRVRVTIPHSKVKENVCRVLKDEGFIGDYRVTTDGAKLLHVYLKYGPNGEKVINEITRVSKPGCRVYKPTDKMPKVLGGMGIAGIMAAILSTAATIFIAAGFGLSRDLYERLAARDVSEKQKIFHARIAQVIVGCIVFVIALFKPLSIYWVGAWSGALFATAWMPMLVAGFEWRRVTRQGAYASMILGLGSYVLLYQMVRVWKMFKLPLNIDPIIFGIIISCLIIWIVSLLTKAKEGDLAMFDQLKTIQLSGETMKGFPAPGALQKEIGITKKTAWAVIVISIIFFGWLIMKIVPAVS
jgi:ribosomal protein S8/uncharacterized membrane protein YeaQ/YmgE (transglycosylase-associated protein family)